MVSEDVIRAQLSHTLEKTSFPTLGAKYEGKVRDCYMRGGQRILIATETPLIGFFLSSRKRSWNGTAFSTASVIGAAGVGLACHAYVETKVIPGAKADA